MLCGHQNVNCHKIQEIQCHVHSCYNLYTRAPIGNEINQCQFGVSSLFVTEHSIYPLKFGAGQKTTSAMARWDWLDGRPCKYC